MPPTVPPDVPARIRQLREALGLTQSGLAARLGVRVGAVSRWESGQRRPALAAWLALQRLAAGASSSIAVDQGAVIADHLPLALTRFIGRARELELLEALLDASAVRLLTLTGAGGSGKTRLALALAMRLAPRYADRVRLVELASVTDPADLVQTLATALGVRERPRLSLLQTLTAALAERQQLLVLDNCEHLAAACATLVTTLLRSCPHLQLLATSREPLGVAGETLWPVPPLDLPAPGVGPTAVAESDAVCLFIDRAQLAQPGFALTRDTAPAVVQICARLDGLPLALELAAARLRLLPVTQLAERLDRSLSLLNSNGRAVPARHQTLQSAIDWSYALLTEPEQRLFTRLAVFAGGFDLPAAEAIGVATAAEREHEVLLLLGQLVDKSMVVRDERHGSGRFHLLEPLRQYAVARLTAAGEETAVRDRHARYYRRLAEAFAPDLNGPAQADRLMQLDRELDNLRAALTWYTTTPEGALDEEMPVAEAGVRLAAALTTFWLVRGYFSEGRTWLGRVLSHEAGAPPALRARAMVAAGLLALRQSDRAAAQAVLEEGLQLARQAGARSTAALAAFQAAHSWADSDPERARPLALESLDLYRELHDQGGVADALSALGSIALYRGELDAAQRYQAEAASLYRARGAQHALGTALSYLAFIAILRGDFALAVAHYRESLALLYAVGEQQVTAFGLAGLAGALTYQGTQLVRAAQLFGASEAVREAIGTPLYAGMRPAYERAVAVLRTQLGESAVNEAWAAGRAFSLDQAVQLALADTPAEPAEHPRTTPAGDTRLSLDATRYPHGLSGREVEVLRLLAGGASNKTIGQALTLSVRTVERHIATIYVKIDAHGRAAATAYAHRQGLVPSG